MKNEQSRTLKIEQTKILNELNNFNGTEQYHRASYLYDLNLTDGIQFLREKLNCYWLIDIVGSIQHKAKIIDNQSFIIHRIKVNEDKSFIFKSYRDYDSNKTEQENDTEYLLYEQAEQYTEFKLNEFEFYQIGNVLLLKSEY